MLPVELLYRRTDHPLTLRPDVTHKEVVLHERQQHVQVVDVLDVALRRLKTTILLHVLAWTWAGTRIYT